MSESGSKLFLKVSGGVAGLLAVLAILIAVNVIASGIRLRADLTEEKLYTLTGGTRAILAKLDAPVTLKLYSTAGASEIPINLKDFARQVEDLLAEYRLAGGGKVDIELHNPQPDSEDEEWAQKYGITGQPLDAFGTPFYLGLVAVCGSREAVIPFFDPRAEGMMEYNITRTIYRVTHPKKPVIGVMSSLPVMGRQQMPFMQPGQPPPQPWMAFQDLSEDYEVRQIEPSAESIDADVQALVVVHPKSLPDPAQYAIDQFVLRGGRLLAFLDPMSIVDAESGQQNPYGMGTTPSNLEKLLPAWGVGYAADKVVSDPKSSSRIRAGPTGVEESPVWLSLGPRNINRKDILTAQLESVMIPFGGAFTGQSTADLKFEPLITTSDAAGYVSAMAAQFGSGAIRREYKSEGAPLAVAVRLTGKFKTAFPEGKPGATNETAAAGGTNAPATTASPGLKDGTSTVILVADADLIFDRFCVEEMSFFKVLRPINDNLAFFANIMEQITGSSDLIGIRSRGRSLRPFDRVQAMQQQAMAAWQEQETALEKKLEETQRQLREMESGKAANQRFILTEQQKKAIVSFREEEIRIKKELKNVRKNLRQDIEQLGVFVKVANIALVPVLIFLVGVIVHVYRSRRP